MVRGGEAKWAAAVLMLLMSVKQGAGQQECTSNISSLSACFPYIRKGNNTRVGADCCKPLNYFVSTLPGCVCTLQQLSSSFTNVNLTRADDLNNLCSITSTATLSSCNGSSASPSNATHNGAFTSNKASMFHVALMGLALVVYLLYQA